MDAAVHEHQGELSKIFEHYVPVHSRVFGHSALLLNCICPRSSSIERLGEALWPLSSDLPQSSVAASISSASGKTHPTR